MNHAPRDVLLNILREHKLFPYTTDLHDDKTMPSCSCGHALAEETIEEHQTDLIVTTFLKIISN